MEKASARSRLSASCRDQGARRAGSCTLVASRVQDVVSLMRGGGGELEEMAEGEGEEQEKDGLLLLAALLEGAFSGRGTGSRKEQGSSLSRETRELPATREARQLDPRASSGTCEKRADPHEGPQAGRARGRQLLEEL